MWFIQVFVRIELVKGKSLLVNVATLLQTQFHTNPICSSVPFNSKCSRHHLLTIFASFVSAISLWMCNYKRSLSFLNPVWNVTRILSYYNVNENGVAVKGSDMKPVKPQKLRQRIWQFSYLKCQTPKILVFLSHCWQDVNVNTSFNGIRHK